MISLDQFKQVEMKVGLVTDAVDQEGSDPPAAPDAQHLWAGKLIK